MAKVSDEKIIKALLKCGSQSKAAAELGISYTALKKRLSGEKLKTKYEDAKSSVLTEAVEGMKKRIALALNTLTEVMQDTANPATVRVSAADAMLRHTVRYMEAVEMENRIRALERNMSNELGQTAEGT